jgi:hypothetical protein
MDHKVHKIYQHLPLPDPPKFTQIWIFGLKTNHLATLVWTIVYVHILKFKLWKTVFEIVQLAEQENVENAQFPVFEIPIKVIAHQCHTGLHIPCSVNQCLRTRSGWAWALAFLYATLTPNFYFKKYIFDIHFTQLGAHYLCELHFKE